VIPKDVPFIELIGWACVGSGLIVMVGGVVLAIFESKLNKEVSDGMADLSKIADKLTGMDLNKLVTNKDANEFARNLTGALTRTAGAFSEFVRASRSPAKSVPALRAGVVLFLVAATLAVVDHSVAPKEPSTAASTSTSTTTTSSTTTTTLRTTTT
jgi:hypothetical protein